MEDQTVHFVSQVYLHNIASIQTQNVFQILAVGFQHLVMSLPCGRYFHQCGIMLLLHNVLHFQFALLVIRVLLVTHLMCWIVIYKETWFPCTKGERPDDDELCFWSFIPDAVSIPYGINITSNTNEKVTIINSSRSDRSRSRLPPSAFVGV